MQNPRNSKRTFFTDIWRKFAALALGLLAFFNLDKASKVEKTVRGVPVNVKPPNAEFVIREGYEKQSAVILVKSPRIGQEFEADGFSIEVVIPEEKLAEGPWPKEITIRLRKDTHIDINNAFRHTYKGIKTSLVPDPGKDVREIRLEVDRMTTKQVPVTVIKGNPENAELTAIATLDKKNQTVNLYGPSEKLTRIKEVRTKPLDLKGHQKPTTFRTRLKLDSREFGSDITVDGPSEVYVDVELVNALALVSHSFAPTPVSILSPVSGNLQVFYTGIGHPTANVVISGKPDVVERFQAMPPVVCVDLRDVTDEGELNAPVHVLNLNDSGLKEVLVEPRTLQLFVKRVPQEGAPR